jgi:hypothetical protein
MKLSPEQSRKIFLEYGCWLTSACDKCGKLLGSVRYTCKGQESEWCSALCRDGEERQLGVCRGCGASLNGKRKGARWCDDSCRKRPAHRGGLTTRYVPGIVAHSKELTNPVRGLPYSRSFGPETKQFTNERE